MRKRYPQTLAVLVLLVALGVLLAITALWRPAVYIVLGLFVVYFIASAVREDRKHRP